MEAPNKTSDYNSEMGGLATQKTHTHTHTHSKGKSKQKMESAQLAEEALSVLDSSLSHIKWRLKASSKRRLQIDVLALCSAMRPVVMVDYGGKMPELQDRLCALLELTQKESTIFHQLRLMVIDDMIYIVNVGEFAEYITWSLSSDVKQFFVDLEQEPLKMISSGDESSTVKELASVQKLFSAVFTAEGVNFAALKGEGKDNGQNIESSSAEHSQFSKVVDLSSCLHNSQITIPTVNGWLLGYPVVYLFDKDHIPDAVYNLSTQPLRIFRVLVCRNISQNNSAELEELMSFSVPYDLSLDGRTEPWAEAFWVQMEAKWERCKQVWRSMEMEVSECYPQAIAL